MTVSPTATFPQPWTTDGNPDATYFLDAMHHPFPATPLEQTITGSGNVGFVTALREYGVAVERFDFMFRNFFRFGRMVIAEPASPEEAQRQGELIEATVQREIARLIERWYGEHLPAIQELIGHMAGLDPRGLPGDEVVAMLEDLQATSGRLWTIHFRIAPIMLASMQLFDEFYADLFAESEADGHALLVGAVSSSVEAGFRLADLGDRARTLGLEAVFRATPADALLPALEASGAGRTLLAELAAYLDDYGLRQDLFALATPTWREDPAIPLANIRAYLLSGRDERAEHAARTRAAEEALAATRARLTTYPTPIREQFETLLQYARHGAFIQEEHNFAIDQPAQAHTRLFCLRLGERLVEGGLVEQPEDVFMLRLEEIVDLLTDPDAAGTRDIARTIQTRRAEYGQAWTLDPPPFLGPAPSEPAGEGRLLINRATGRFWGERPEEAETPGQISGNAGSRGVATGIARVARTLQEASALQPGEILVAVTTMPPWTPLFGIAVAVVAETGGPLSHCAVVAREYRIPAVVGTHGATRAIQTGQMVTVDGGRGIVTIAE
jgi:pyruvate,water dikinase